MEPGRSILNRPSTMQDSYFTIALANRLILKAKLKQRVFVGRKCYLTVLDWTRPSTDPPRSVRNLLATRSRAFSTDS